MAVFIFTNGTPVPITFNTTSSSAINPNGLVGHTLQDVAVTLHGLEHIRSDNLDIVLSHGLGSNERNFMFASDAGLASFFGATVRFSDAASNSFPLGGDTRAGGHYLPTALDLDERPEHFGLTEPLLHAGPAGGSTFSSVFDGQSVAGTFRLLIRDDMNDAFDGGQITGWSLTLTTDRSDVQLAGGTGADSYLVISTSATAGRYIAPGASPVRYSGVTGFTIDGAAGDDLIQSGAGNDLLYDGTGIDAVFGGAGNDRIITLAQDLILNGAQLYDGGAGRDQLTVDFFTQSLLDLRQHSLAGLEVLELAGNVVGNNIRIVRLDAAQFGPGLSTTGRIIGSADTNKGDVIEIRMGGVTQLDLSDLTLVNMTNDQNFAQDGFSIVGDASSETIGGTSSLDTIVGAAGNDRIATGAARDFIEAGGGNDSLYGGADTDLMRGDEGADVLDGGTGNDFMEGGTGNDLFIVDSTQDSVNDYLDQGFDIVTTRVSYRLSGLSEAEIELLRTTSNAGTAAIDLTGNALSQTVMGNAGANMLNGAAGNDVLTGLGGADSFRFSTGLGSTNVDRITDYSVAADRIEIDNAVFTGLATGALAASAFRANAAGQAADSSDRIIYDTDDGILYFDADGNAAGGRVRFAFLEAGLAMTAAEFLVI
jgi:Ca2+-binding RTX toxin-like protein